MGLFSSSFNFFLAQPDDPVDVIVDVSNNFNAVDVLIKTLNDVVEPDLGVVVHIGSTETITGSKTFSQSVNFNSQRLLNVATPTGNFDGANKDYVDVTKALIDSTVVHIDGNETITGTKTFAVEVTAPDLKSSGLNGLLPGRFVGEVFGNPPIDGSFSTGDWVVDNSATPVIWVCISSGSPGTWVTSGDKTFVHSSGTEVIQGAKTFTSEVTAPDMNVTGLNALSPGRFVGEIAGATPSSGTFQVGDYVVDQSATPSVWICTVAGTPGTWVRSGDLSFVHSAGAETIQGAKTFATEVTAPDYKASGINGLALGRFVGEVSGATPNSGTFQVGDYVVDNSATPTVWICTTAGSPGIWAISGNKIFAHLAGNETITGTKTFSTPPVSLTDPVNLHDLTTKNYIDTQFSKVIIPTGLTGDGVTDVSTNIQAALDSAGTSATVDNIRTVWIPPGRHACQGLLVPSYVEITGPGILLQINPGNSVNLLSTKTVTTTGSVTIGQNLVTLTSVTGVHLGALITLEGTGIIDPLQQTTLASDCTDTDTILHVVSTNHSPATGAFWVIDNEVLKIVSISGNDITVTRNVLGTTAAAHTAGTTIGPALVARGIVSNISGNVVTLQDALTIENPMSATRTVSGTTILIGAVGCRIIINTDGQRNVLSGTLGTSRSKLVELTHASQCYVRTIGRYGTDAALFLRSAIDCICEVTAIDCGNGAGGGPLWFYQGCYRNHVTCIITQWTVAGAIFFDDRSNTGNKYDASPQQNSIVGTISGTKNIASTSAAVNFDGCAGNSFRGAVYGFKFAVRFIPPVNQSIDGTRSRGVKYNSFSGSAQNCQYAGSFDVDPNCVGNIIGPLSTDSGSIQNDVIGVAQGNKIIGVMGHSDAPAPGFAVGTTLYALKTTDETRTNNTLVDDADLFIPLDASSTYKIEGTFKYGSSSVNPDFKYVINVPTGATGFTGATGIITTTTTPSNNIQMPANDFGVNATAGTVATNIMHARFSGVVKTSTTAGNLQIQWAENTIDASGTTLYTNSVITALKLAG